VPVVDTQPVRPAFWLTPVVAGTSSDALIAAADPAAATAPTITTHHVFRRVNEKRFIDLVIPRCAATVTSERSDRNG
jgi:hypothetical protein